ncbi:acyltransferase [Silicimonas algicola]|uniref:acyltransferase n=2 Tax=Silicimonas algicola TaxID=1826607 RepID=UPI0013E0B990|nr:acyltransferase [Silicimonas algicola]
MLRSYGAKIGRSVQTYGHFFRGVPHGLELGDGVRIMKGALLSVDNIASSLTIGRDCYINRNTTIDCHVGIHVGERVAIGPNVYIGDFDHGPMAGSGRSMYGRKGEVIIEEDVWIGANATILRGVTIGVGATVGAGSVVTKNVDAGDMVAGNPARRIHDS